MADPELKVIISADDRASPTLKQINSALRDLSNQALKVGTALEGMAVAIGTALYKMTTAFADTAHELVDINAKTGMSVEALSEMKYILDLEGLTLYDLQTAWRGLSLKLEEASAGSATAIKLFTALGLSVQDILKMSPEDRFWTIAEAIAGVDDSTKRAYLATELFGRSGMNLLPVLAKGKDALEAERKAAHDLGVTMTIEDVKAGDAMHDSMVNLHEAIKGLGNTLGKEFIPYLLNVVEKITTIVERVKDWAAQHPDLMDKLTKLAEILGVGGLLFLAFAAILKLIMTVNAAIAAMQILMTGPVGTAMVAGAAAAALAFVGGITYGVSKIMEAATPAPGESPEKATAEATAALSPIESYQYGGIVAGGPLGSPKLVMAHVGEEFAGVGRRMGGDIHVHIGTLIADEPSQRKLARILKQLMMEDDRRTSFPHINQGYFYGRSAI